jgi:hypothetical protein
VIDLDVVEHNFRRMRELLPAAHIFYAVKANPARQILGAWPGSAPSSTPPRAARSSWCRPPA